MREFEKKSVPRLRNTKSASPTNKNRKATLQLKRSVGNNPTQRQYGSEEGKESINLLSSIIQKPRVTRVDGGILATVYFGQDQFILDLSNLQVVEKLSEELSVMTKPTVIVDGHASTEGSSEYNNMLAKRRRQVVIAVLKSRLLDTIEFRGKSYGESQPIVAEDAESPSLLEEQRAQNRRAVIFITREPDISSPKPIDLSLPVRPPTPEETLDRVLKEPPPSPPPKRPLSEMAREKFDAAVEDILRKAGVPAKYRDFIKKGARDLVEKGLEKALDTALDQTGLDDNTKKAIKESIKAVYQTKF